MGQIVLCADTESCIHPELMGLDEATVNGTPWLTLVSSAQEARNLIAELCDIDEAWLVSSDEMDGINLCAALRKDRPHLPLYLIANNASGSELSRASQAGINRVLSTAELTMKWGSEVRKRMIVNEVEELDIETELEEATYEPPYGPKHDMHHRPQHEMSCDASSEGNLEPPHGSQHESPQETTYEPPHESQQEASKDIALNPHSYIISILSGSGGVGKSALCAVAAYLCTASGYRVAVIDGDLQFGDMHQVMGDVPMISIDTILANQEMLAHLASEGVQAEPVVISAPTRLERSETLSDHLDELIAAVSQAFDIVLVNTGANWSGHHAQLLELSTCSIFVLDQRASSVRTCKHALELCMRMGVASGSFIYALNKCGRHALFTSLDIANALSGAHVFELKDGGLEVEELLGAGLASELAASKNPFCQSVQALLKEVLP